MTSQERQVLVDAEVPATQRHNCILLWIIRAFVEGREAGHFLGGAGFEDQFLEKVHVCRAQYGAIGDELQGRMPLAYAHIVQVLVDIILWMYPFMAFSSGMSGLLCVLGTGLLTVGYQGLFDLAKQFLDPYDNESYGKGEDPLVVDTLIAETNAGSLRWMYGLEEFPVSSQRMKDGELSDYLLPIRGYTVDELAQMEEERLQKERELQEKREKEEEERRKAEEAENRIRDAAEALIDLQMGNTTASQVVSTLEPPNLTVEIDGLFRNIQRESKGVVSLSSATKVLDIVSVMGDCEVDELVPNGTAPAAPEIFCFDEEPGNDSELEKDKEETVEDSITLFGGEDVLDDEMDGIADEEWATNGDVNYVHAFDAFDPYGDLPWYEEVGPDGKEIRLSQQLADEIWDEEIESVREKEATLTFEEFAQKAAEIKDAKESELLETQEIMLESPGSQNVDMSPKDEADAAPMYDQTKLDGVSQLWGLPPDELSEIPGYEEPDAPPAEISGISQLWGGEASAAPLDSSASEPMLDEFDGISQLWGEESLDFGITSSGSVSPTGTRRILDETDIFPVVASEQKESRLSQELAEEVWEEEDVVESPVEAITFEDYTKQVKEILDMEKEEMLETAAIMNAPPGADSVEILENDYKENLVQGVNATSSKEDLAVLEMDEPLDEHGAIKDDRENLAPTTDNSILPPEQVNGDGSEMSDDDGEEAEDEISSDEGPSEDTHQNEHTEPGGDST